MSDGENDAYAEGYSRDDWDDRGNAAVAKACGMSETPRTDARRDAIYQVPYVGAPYIVDADFARQLEKELTAKDARVKELEAAAVLQMLQSDMERDRIRWDYDSRIEACRKRIAKEERCAGGHNLARMEAEKHCKRLSTERDELKAELTAEREKWNRAVDQIAETIRQRDAERARVDRLAEALEKIAGPYLDCGTDGEAAVARKQDAKEALTAHEARRNGE